MTREEAIKCIHEEKLRYERAPWVNSCPMMEEWQKAIDICDMAISALRAQQEQESKPLNGWISVEERLPEDQVEVLVLTRSMKGMRNVDKGYLSIDHFIHRGRAQVTHWMPIPELPERGKMEE